MQLIYPEKGAESRSPKETGGPGLEGRGSRCAGGTSSLLISAAGGLGCYLSFPADEAPDSNPHTQAEPPWDTPSSTVQPHHQRWTREGCPAWAMAKVTYVSTNTSTGSREDPLLRTILDSGRPHDGGP